jgi:hypothetical protein
MKTLARCLRLVILVSCCIWLLSADRPQQRVRADSQCTDYSAFNDGCGLGVPCNSTGYDYDYSIPSGGHGAFYSFATVWDGCPNGCANAMYVQMAVYGGCCVPNGSACDSQVGCCADGDNCVTGVCQHCAVSGGDCNQESCCSGEYCSDGVCVNG